MSSWWLPFGFSFRNLATPLSIQRRFISFILKRSLGHLLKPGQLDINQIDAQIGSGFVEVKDLVLDDTAINTFLNDLPIRLESGTIGTVTVRIPWPNPFSSTVGLSVSGLRLTFRTTKLGSESQGKDYATELAESITSAGESFLHDELSEREEALLRDSIHPDFHPRKADGLNSSSAPPGSLDPFLDREQEPINVSDNDPEGISIFASLFESLLARFDFDASDLQVSLVHPESTAFTLHVEQLRYGTERPDAAQDPSEASAETSLGETRSVSIAGLKMTMRNLLPSPVHYPQTPFMLAPSKGPPTPSFETSDSEMDEETQEMMSHSLVSLPLSLGEGQRRPLSPSLSTISSASAASSLYQSATSASKVASRPASPNSRSETLTRTLDERVDQIIMVISEPLVIRLTTPPACVSREFSVLEPSFCPSEPLERGKRNTPERLKLEISFGVLAIALQAQNVHGILDVMNVLSSISKHSQSIPRKKPVASSPALHILGRLDCTLRMKGIVALALGNPDEPITKETGLAITQFFARPLNPPPLPCGYLRLYIDSIQVVASMPSSPISQYSSSRHTQTSTSAKEHPPLASCTISDISILAFHSPSSPNNPRPRPNASSPIMITDLNLVSSYHIATHSQSSAYAHSHPYSEESKQAPLPSFDVVDWLSVEGRSRGPSPRAWRSKAVQMPLAHHRKVSGGLVAGLVSSAGLSTSPTRTIIDSSMGSPPRQPAKPLLSTSPQQSQRGSYKRTGPLKDPPIPFMSLEVSYRDVDGVDVVLETVPLHVFLDLELFNCILDFVDEALPNPSGSSQSSCQSSPTSAQGICMTSDEGYEQSHGLRSDERKRLEQLVVDDLDLGLDYRQSGETTPSRRSTVTPTPRRRGSKGRHHLPSTEFHIETNIPLLRAELRVPPPHGSQLRSGSLILDIHNLHYSSHPSSGASGDRRVPRFRESSSEKNSLEDWFSNAEGKLIASFDISRLLIAYTSLGELKAQVVASLGPITDMDPSTDHDGGSMPPLLPLVLIRSQKTGVATTSSGLEGSSTAVLIRIPSLHVLVNKNLLDGLQLWADDLSQWGERLTSGTRSGSSTNATISRNPSLIGSRYFVHRTGSASTESDFTSTVSPANAKNELVIKAVLLDAFVRLVIPAGEEVGPAKDRHLDICASDLDALVESKPEGKDETILTLSVLDANITENSSNGTHTIVTNNSLSITKGRQAMFKLRFHSVIIPGANTKESRVKAMLSGVRIHLWSEVEWITDIIRFVKAPPGAFESVIPSERTRIAITVMRSAVRVTPPTQPSALVLSLGDVNLSAELVGDSPETTLKVVGTAMSIFLIDDVQCLSNSEGVLHPESDVEYWTRGGYALLATIENLNMILKHNVGMDPPETRVGVESIILRIHLCADTISGIAAFAADLQSLTTTQPDEDLVPRANQTRRPTKVSESQSSSVFRSLDEQAFRRHPVIGPLPDMIDDDLPTNLEYLDASFGAAAGFRPLEDDDNDNDNDNDEEEFITQPIDAIVQSTGTTISKHGGETVRMLCPSINIIENFYGTFTASSIDDTAEHGDTRVKVRIQDCHVYLLLFDGYDWARTRRVIQEEVKRVKRRLAKIRQLLANGQAYDPNVDEINAVLFNSVYVGLDQDAESLERDALMAAIDEELIDDVDAATEGSWQSFKPNTAPKIDLHRTGLRSKELKRHRDPSIEFSLRGMTAEFDQYRAGATIASRVFFTIRDLEILDHIKTSTWSKFLTELRSDSRGNVRETDSNMVRVELQMLLPYPGHLEQEARLKAKLLPLRLHVDQDALDFLKKFFSFHDDDVTPSPPPENEIFFQHVEVFPVDIKLDYKPRRVDYRALKEGKTIELMNFFHFDGSEMTLRHITLKGISGWPRMFDTLNDLWTPDVKANQLVDVISGVSPIRSAVNVGSGVADLILLPIAQYKKDGRIIRGLQKGTTAFVKSTAMEAIRLGARLATGTQVVLEQAETVLGGQFKGTITAEALQITSIANDEGDLTQDGEDDAGDLFSKYAEQPTNLKEGVQSAYKTLSQNIKTAGQTILAVPMEVYERSGNEGPARAVIRAVPIAVLKPMIGASEAISKTLLGLHNTLDPQGAVDSDLKYKHR